MKYSFLIIVLLLPFFAYAISKSVINTNVDASTSNITQSVPNIAYYDSLLQDASCSKRLDSVKIVLLKDSLEHMQKQIISMQETIKSHEDMLRFDDTCLVALAYRRCLEPYNEKSVKTALGYYNHIFSQELKNARSDVFEALRDYSRAYYEVIEILKRAQSDIDRVGNPFRIEEYKQNYITQLQSTMYYRKYIDKKTLVKLPYVEQIINEAINRLNKHSDINPADFSDLIVED